MNDLLKQLSSYNLFTNLFPGAAFCVMLSEFFGHPLILENLFAAFFFYYFVGIVISRVGSLLVEPIFRLLHVIEPQSYEDYVIGASVDAELKTLSESSAVYRTLVALPICMGVYQLGYMIADQNSLSPLARACVLFASLFVLFTAAYWKQSRYVSKRIAVHGGSEGQTK